MIPMLPNTNIEILAGTLPENAKANTPFSDQACALLADLSTALMRSEEAKAQADVVAFAFWCRKSQLARLKERYIDNHLRLGRGLAFHISPGNVPINAFYSFAFGLLAGNANVVRLPSKASTSVDIILNVLSTLFAKSKYTELAQANAFVRYDAASDITNRLSAACDARIIWGGDATIAQIRKSPLPPRAYEITFADRYSFAVLDADTIAGFSETDLERQAINFFNDTLKMDQNACSSPHLVIWKNGNNTSGKTRFWRAVDAYTKQTYTLEPVQSVDRHTRLLSGFISGPEQQLTTPISNPVQRVNLTGLPANMDTLRGIYGLFYEFDATSLQEVAHIVNIKYQTLTYLGLDKTSLTEFVVENRLHGIDRIVPVGSALDIDTIWDGHDVLKELTRIIDVR